MKTVRASSRGFEKAGTPTKTVQQSLVGKLVKDLGGGYSSSLGINPASAKSEEIFKWFLVSLLLGDSINENVATKAYKELEKAKVSTGASRVVESVKFEVIDPKQINRAFLTFDERKLNAWIRTNKTRIMEHLKKPDAQPLLKGIKLFISTDVSSRG